MIDWNKFDNGQASAFYGTNQWKNKRKQVLERDHGLCQRCLGKWDRQQRITYRRAKVVHHIIPIQKDHALALVDDNLVSLCYSCHEEVEGRSDLFKKHCVKKKKFISPERW